MIYGCFNPQTFVKDGKKLTVSCGKCDYCMYVRQADLTARIQREMLSSRGTVLFLTLTYDNHHMPLYTQDAKGVWRSNRGINKYGDVSTDNRFPNLHSETVPEYYQPSGMDDVPCFGHLCYPDLLAFFSQLRSRFFYEFKQIKQLRKASKRKKYGDNVKRNDIIEKLFANYEYEDLLFRYFACGEYGPSTFRPHYHVIVWYRHEWNREQLSYISEILRSYWKLGSIDIQAVTTSGVDKYLASYVVSRAGLPQVLRRKQIRPFCVFSKAPVIGAITADDDEIRDILYRGRITRTKYNEETKQHDSAVLPPSFYRRYFPKCRRFSDKDYTEQLSVYEYVRNYFNEIGLIYDAGNVDTVRLSDIKWERLPGWSLDVEWTYPDMYASLVAFRYSVKFGIPIREVYDRIVRVYSNLELDKLGNFYREQEDITIDNNHPYGVKVLV